MTNSPSGIRVGAKVRIRHNPEHDDAYGASKASTRRRMNGQIGRVEELANPLAGRSYLVQTELDAGGFEADELVPVVTDPDGIEVGGPGPRAPDPIDALDAAVQLALGEARRMRDELAAVRAERDALQGKLAAVTEAWGKVRAWWSPACEEELATLEAVDRAPGVPEGEPVAPWPGT